MDSYKLGQRIVDPADKARGTIKFLGTVDGTKGSWIGVEWDSPLRGKHNGSHNDKKYFETKTATSGSFVRESKISTGVSLEHAWATLFMTKVYCQMKTQELRLSSPTGECAVKISVTCKSI